MIKRSNKKRLQKDIHILKIQGNTAWRFKAFSFWPNMPRYDILHKNVYLRNLGFLVYDHFLEFGQWAQVEKSASSPPKKVKFQVCFYQRFTDNMTVWSH